MILTMRQWTVRHPLNSFSSSRSLGGVEMEEKGERYRDGEKVRQYVLDPVGLTD